MTAATQISPRISACTTPAPPLKKRTPLSFRRLGDVAHALLVPDREHLLHGHGSPGRIHADFIFPFGIEEVGPLFWRVRIFDFGLVRRQTWSGSTSDDEQLILDDVFGVVTHATSGGRHDLTQPFDGQGAGVYRPTG